MRAQTFWTVVVAIAGAILLRDLFPRTEQIPSVPRIVTRYDTVRVIDTAWITRLRHDTVRVNTVERVVVTVPETVRVVPRLRGITAVSVAKRWGDSSLVGGFSLVPLDSGYERRAWTAQLYTPGPLRSLLVDPDVPAPRATFYAPPPPPCGLLCAAKHYLLGGTVGFGACTLGNIVR